VTASSDAPVSVPASSSAAYGAAAEHPTQRGPDGILFDFNDGARVELPDRDSGLWRVVLSDLDTGNVLFEGEPPGGAFVRSVKRFFVRFRVQVWDVAPDGTSSAVLDHAFDAHDKDVLIRFPSGTLGDILAWFPSAARFWQVHGCRLTCAMAQDLIDLLRPGYPQICFVPVDAATNQRVAENAYASYSIGLFFTDADFVWQPTDFRHVGLHRTAAYILGVDPVEEPCRLVLPDESRPIDDPYVCIAVQSSSQNKQWNNPMGWRGVIAFLKGRGFRVICIDKAPVYGQGLVWNHIPHGAEDETGDRPLAERARWLRHAAAFVGLSSGLAWLAWAAGTPVAMISGFTHPTNEFFTPYRIINWHACNRPVAKICP
jgi:hypothetical protein